MEKLVVLGCSNSTGMGLYPDPFRDGRNHPDLWINILHRECFPQTKLVNDSQNGWSNHEIFVAAARHLISQQSSDKIKIMIVQWTSWPRYNLPAGCELYNTNICLHSSEHDDYKINAFRTVPRKFIKRLSEDFLGLHNPFAGMLDMLTFGHTLYKLAQLTATPIYFFNIGVWTSEFFQKVVPSDSISPNDLDPYTKKIIDIQAHNDDEIWQIYDKIHDDMTKACDIDSPCWLNLQDPYNPKSRPDSGSDGLHGGALTHASWANYIKQRILH